MTDSLAGVIKLFSEKFFRPCVHVVYTLTGSGLKNTDTLFRVAQVHIKIEAKVTAVERVLQGIL